VYVQFYDRGADPNNRLTGLTLARSTDAGRSFTNYAWSDSTFEGHNAFLGDYTWLTAYDGRVYGIWAEPATVAMLSTTGASPAATRVGTVVRIGTADFRRKAP
jgi:hypothetical protein